MQSLQLLCFRFRLEHDIPTFISPRIFTASNASSAIKASMLWLWACEDQILLPRFLGVVLTTGGRDAVSLVAPTPLPLGYNCLDALEGHVVLV